MRQTFYTNEQRQIYRAVVPGAHVTLLAVAHVFGREALHVVSRVSNPKGGVYRGVQQPHWVVRLLSSLRLFRPDDRGNPLGVTLCTRQFGRGGKGRAAQHLGLTHFVDNEMDCWAVAN